MMFWLTAIARLDAAMQHINRDHHRWRTSHHPQNNASKDDGPNHDIEEIHCSSAHVEGDSIQTCMHMHTRSGQS